MDNDKRVIVRALVGNVIGLFGVLGSDGETVYDVDVDPVERTVFCDCPDFIYRKQTEKWGGAKIDDEAHHCKHIKKVIDSYGEMINGRKV